MCRNLKAVKTDGKSGLKPERVVLETTDTLIKFVQSTGQSGRPEQANGNGFRARAEFERTGRRVNSSLRRAVAADLNLPVVPVGSLNQNRFLPV
jgi:hypothetical protein